MFAEVLESVLHLQMILILMKIPEDATVGEELKNLIFQLLLKLLLLALNLEEYSLTLNKLRPSYIDLIPRKELRITYCVDLIMTR